MYGCMQVDTGKVPSIQCMQVDTGIPGPELYRYRYLYQVFLVYNYSVRLSRDLSRGMPLAIGHGKGCDSSLPSPRVHVYNIPHTYAPAPTVWRNVRALKYWIERSHYHEANPYCADYFLIPMHPMNRDGRREVGDLRMLRLIDYIRFTWPFWNATIRAGKARHFMMLPCDHGPGDCAFSRPILPNKYVPGGKPHALHLYDGLDELRQWGYNWETINPASPARFLFFLVYNGWADQLRTQVGNCLSCFQAGLDIRMPTPEGHECGPACGLHYLWNASGGHSFFVDSHLQRILLDRAARRSPVISPAVARPAPRCNFSWAGAVRGGNNPARVSLLKLQGIAGMCVTNTIDKSKVNGNDRTALRAPSIPEAMIHSRFCYAPRGWDQGDSDRYLPAIMYGCIPIMSDKLEGMPLEELPEMAWNASTLAVEHQSVPALPRLLASMPAAREAALRAAGRQMVERLLYTTLEFSPLPGRGVPCGGCARARTDCPVRRQASVPRGRREGAEATARKGAKTAAGLAAFLARRDSPEATPRSLVRKLAAQAHTLGINLETETVCGRNSYFGEVRAPTTRSRRPSEWPCRLAAARRLAHLATRPSRALTPSPRRSRLSPPRRTARTMLTRA